MIRYFLHGLEVPRDGACKAWLRSKTYRRAAHKESIWPLAEKQTEQGELSKVLRNHLSEAHISMERVDGDATCPP